ncbi:hypothetical protein D3C87_1403910 [compost metagenome]
MLMFASPELESHVLEPLNRNTQLMPGVICHLLMKMILIRLGLCPANFPHTWRFNCPEMQIISGHFDSQKGLTETAVKIFGFPYISCFLAMNASEICHSP